MPDPKLCKNCLELLCSHPGPLHWHGSCALVPEAGPHHIDGSSCNDLCTRAPVVLVKGCYECPSKGTGRECRLDAQLRDITNYWYKYKRGGALRPDWCPLLANKAGVTLRAALPAKEAPVLGPYPAPGLDQAVEIHRKTMEREE